MYIYNEVKLTAAAALGIAGSCTPSRLKSNDSESENSVPSDVGVTGSSGRLLAVSASLSVAWRRSSLDGDVCAYSRCMRGGVKGGEGTGMINMVQVYFLLAAQPLLKQRLTNT